MISRVREFRAADGYRRWERRTTLPLAVLAALFLATLLVDLLWERPPQPVTLTRDLVDYVVWALFLVDYLTRLYLAAQRWRFVRTHVLDLFVVGIPMARPLRLLRLARLGAVLGVLHRRSRGTAHVRVAVSVAGTSLLLLFVAAAAMYDAERHAPGATIHSFGDALWWAAGTVTTVGYGDVVPVTVEGRLIAVALMIVGISLLGVVTAAVAAWFVDQLRGVRDAAAIEESTLTEVMTELRAIREQNGLLARKVEELSVLVGGEGE